MEQIRQLQLELKNIQSKNRSVAECKLSVRNVIDVVMKLKEENAEFAFYVTNNRKDIVTKQKLEMEIEMEVIENHGRMKVEEIANRLGVNEDVVAKIGQYICSVKQQKVYYYVFDEILHISYIVEMMDMINERLMQSTNGYLSIGDLSQQYDLNLEFMQSLVLQYSSRETDGIQGNVQHGKLYTLNYYRKQKALIRGVLKGSTRPVSILNLKKKFQLDGKELEKMVGEILRECLNGKMRGNEYVPNVYLEAQRHAMFSFFEQNRYITHKRAQSLNISRSFDFLKLKYPNAIDLQDAVVDYSVLQQVEGVVEMAIAEDKYADVKSSVPFAVNDVAGLLQRCKAVQENKVVVVAQTYVVSKKFRMLCLEKCKLHGHKIAGPIAALLKKQILECEVEEEEEEDGKGRKSRKSKKKNKEEEEDVKGKKGKKKKNKVKEHKVQSIDDHVPKEEELIDLFCEWFDDLNNHMDMTSELVQEMENSIYREYVQIFQAVKASVHKGDATNLRELRSKFEALYEDERASLMLHNKALEKMQVLSVENSILRNDTIAELEIILLEQEGIRIANLVTSFACASKGVAFDAVAPIIADPTKQDEPKTILKELTKEQKEYLESALPSEIASTVVKLWTLATAGRRSIEDFICHLQTVSECFHIPLKKLDRKRERQMIFALRMQTIEAINIISGVSHARLICQNTAMLLFHQFYALPLSILDAPISLISNVFKLFLFPKTPEDIAKQIVECIKLSTDTLAIEVDQYFLYLMHNLYGRTRYWSQSCIS